MSVLTYYDVRFTLADGRVLVCNYSHHHVPMDFNNPDEDTVSDPMLTLDGAEVTVEELPKGLDKIAELMYDDPFHSDFECTFETGGGNEPF